MKQKLAVCLTLVLLLQPLLQACDMSAVIMRTHKPFGNSVSQMPDTQWTDFNSAQDYPAYVMSRSDEYTNSDGYGILYYPRDSYLVDETNYWYKYVHSYEEHGYVWYTGNYFDPENLPDIFDCALRNINDPANQAGIVMCHSRFATSYPFAPGNHPFRLDANGHTYALMHNGTIPSGARLFMISQIKRLYPYWFEQHEPNFTDFANVNSPSGWIDSEVLLHYLMSWITASGYNVMSGLCRGLQELNAFTPLTTMVVNFVFSDGERLYAYRTTPLTASHKLSFKYSSSGFWGIRTGEPTATETQLLPGELVILSSDKAVERHPDFTGETAYATGQADDELQPISLRVTGNPIVPGQLGINISFTLQEQARVKISVFNPKGQLVRRLNDSVLQPGPYSFRWDGTNSQGRKTGRGVYYIEIINGTERHLNRVLYLS